MRRHAAERLGDADLSRVEAVISAIPAGTTDAVLVMKSTVPPGTGARLRRTLDERGLSGVGYASNPEFLREGSAIHDFQHPDRVVVGAEEPAVGERIAALYRAFGGSELITDVTSAEMIKHASNAFLATKISFINEIANVCEEVGANVDLVAQGMGLDARIGSSFLRPGLGFGGSCFPKDVAALKQLAGNSGYHFQLLSAVIEVNELQKRRAVAKLKRHLGSLRDRRIALWGLAFKPDTDDMREASSVVLAARLIAEGAHVAGYDPIVTHGQASALLPRGIELTENALDAARGADAVVIVTEWPEFRAPFTDGSLLAGHAHAARDRRSQPARSRSRPRRRIRLRGRRARRLVACGVRVRAWMPSCSWAGRARACARSPWNDPSPCSRCSAGRCSPTCSSASPRPA